MSRIAVIVGERLRHRRQELGYSQEKVSEMAGLHPTYVGQLERGEKNATIESIWKICNALCYPMEELFEKIVCGEGGETVANQCYMMLRNRPSVEQEQLYELLRQMIAYKEGGGAENNYRNT